MLSEYSYLIKLLSRKQSTYLEVKQKEFLTVEQEGLARIIICRIQYKMEPR